MLTITFANSQFTLLADKALWWPDHKALLIADVHLGKDAVFRRHGIAIPVGDVADNLQRLSLLVAETQAEQLFVLGDFVHAAPVEQDPFLAEFSAWRQRHQQLAITVILGNHDHGLDRLPAEWQLRLLPSLSYDDILLIHEPEHAGDNDYFIAGHIHPCYRFKMGREGMRLPVFWQQAQGLILPSFGGFTGGYNITPAKGDKCYAVGDQEVSKVL